VVHVPLPGTTGHDVRIPEDVTIDALLPIRCGPYKELFRIRFFSTGMSCGGVISLSRLGISYDVRVNWLTGGVDVVAVNRT
jgi:general secretion pathway protein H